MRATRNNSTGACERCGIVKPFVIASGFNEDGSFRHLCGPCERIEWYRNQQVLFPDLYRRPAMIQPEPEEIEEPEPDHSNQMALFGGG